MAVEGNAEEKGNGSEAYLSEYSEDEQERIVSNLYEIQARSGEVSREWHEKGVRLLGVLNGGALVALLSLASALIGKDKLITPLHPPAWSFSIGLVLALMVVLLTMIVFSHLANHRSKLNRKVQNDEIGVGTAWQLSTQKLDNVERALTWSSSLLIGGAFLAFVLGIWLTFSGL